jgi:hypothetical protein
MMPNPIIARHRIIRICEHLDETKSESVKFSTSHITEISFITEFLNANGGHLASVCSFRIEPPKFGGWGNFLTLICRIFYNFVIRESIPIFE